MKLFEHKLDYKRSFLFYVFNIGILILFLGLSIGLTHVGVHYEKVTFKSNTEKTISATFAIPTSENNCTKDGKYASIILLHGFCGSRQMMIQFSQMLSSAGFATLAVDEEGHGSSDIWLEDTSRDVIAAIEYLKTRNDINVDFIGLLGHSMGGSAVMKALTTYSSSIRASVVIGSNINNTVLPSNASNMMFAVGRFEELVSPSKIKSNFAIFSGIEEDSLVIGDTYGNFENRTARKLILPSTNHIFELIDHSVLLESTYWFGNSMNCSFNKIKNPRNYPALQFLYILTGLSWIGLLMFCYLLARFFINKNQNIQELKEVETPLFTSKKSEILHVLLHGFISLVSLLIGFPFANLMPMPFLATFLVWFVIGTVLYAFRIWRLKKITLWNAFTLPFHPPFTWRAFFSTEIGFWIILFAPIQAIVHSQPFDFRFVLPLFAPITGYRLIVLLFFWAVASIFFAFEIEALSDDKKLSWKSLIRNSIARMYTIVIILLIQYIPILIREEPFLSGLIGFASLFLIPFVLLMILFSAIDLALKEYGYHGSYSGIVLSGLISWMLCSTLPFRKPLST